MLRLPPEKRELNTVFQNYALFPHMNVERNVAYALRLMGMPARQREARVAEMLKLVQMEGYEKRMPDKLSGGQRQRIAIARAVAPGRKLLLLDEPLGALDLKLRRQMQEEIKGLQKELGIAFLYITHDQEEALNMSDRIGILHEGRLEQLGTPEEIYERPTSRFAAEFIGQSTLLPCRVLAVGTEGMTLDFAGQKLPARATSGFRAGDEALVCLRNERVACLSPEAAAEASLPGTLVSRHYAGGSVRYVIELDAGPRGGVRGSLRRRRGFPAGSAGAGRLESPGNGGGAMKRKRRGGAAGPAHDAVDGGICGHCTAVSSGTELFYPHGGGLQACGRGSPWKTIGGCFPRRICRYWAKVCCWPFTPR